MLPPPEGVERMVTECCACNCLKTYDVRWRLQRNSVFVSVKKNPMIRKISGYYSKNYFCVTNLWTRRRPDVVLHKHEKEICSSRSRICLHYIFPPSAAYRAKSLHS